MIALLDQLVNVVGVAQSDISIGDSTGLWVNELYNPVHTRFPDLRYVDARGTLGRTVGVRSTSPFYWSTTEANGKKQDYLMQAVVDAKYLINFAILKSHERAGVTETAKNHFGSFSGGNNDTRKPTTTDYYNLHLRLPLENSGGAWPDRALMAQYRPLVDMNVHAAIGGKTFLYLLDAIYTGRGWSGAPSKWRVAPFCTEPDCGSGEEAWPSSLFLSMDPVAIDSVGFDFLRLRTDWVEVLQAEGVQDYLHEMALADDPPSGTVYDPERDGHRPTSQGAHEHWNAAPVKHYTRNLGNGAGVDLLYLTADPNTFGHVRRADEALAVDGSAESAWDAAPAQNVARILLGGGEITGPGDLSATFRALYDDTNLYVWVDVTDEQLTRDSTGWSDDDSVALFVDGNYSRGPAYDGANDFELGFRWNDSAINRGLSSAPVPPGATFAMTASAGGYRLEVKLPLAELGAPVAYGRLFGLDVQVNDDDGGAGRDAKMAWWASGDTSSAQPSAFGPGRLEGPEKVRVNTAADGTGIRLSWTHYAWNEAYEVHRSAVPYFAPGSGTPVADVPAPAEEFVDYSADAAAYYVVRAREDTAGVSSNRVARFAFSLVRP
jgi:hypothetical protein